MTSTPVGAARADRAACCVVEWEAQDGLPAEQKDVRWACALVSNQMGGVAYQGRSKLPCLQLHVILFLPAWESRGVPDLVAFAQ